MLRAMYFSFDDLMRSIYAGRWEERNRMMALFPPFFFVFSFFLKIFQGRYYVNLDG